VVRTWSSSSEEAFYHLWKNNNLIGRSFIMSPKEEIGFLASWLTSPQEEAISSSKDDLPVYYILTGKDAVSSTEEAPQPQGTSQSSQHGEATGSIDKLYVSTGKSYKLAY
jgi:hypothetical protein